jgi:hypothetical protein
MLLQEEVERKCIDIFKNIINKNSKLRMNFVFILQFFRINNQFEIGIGQIHSLHCLISEFLESVLLYLRSVTTVVTPLYWNSWWYCWWLTT